MKPDPEICTNEYFINGNTLPWLLMPGGGAMLGGSLYEGGWGIAFGLAFGITIAILDTRSMKKLKEKKNV